MEENKRIIVLCGQTEITEKYLDAIKAEYPDYIILTEQQAEEQKIFMPFGGDHKDIVRLSLYEIKKLADDIKYMPLIDPPKSKKVNQREERYRRNHQDRHYKSRFRK